MLLKGRGNQLGLKINTRKHFRLCRLGLHQCIENKFLLIILGFSCLLLCVENFFQRSNGQENNKNYHSNDVVYGENGFFVNLSIPPCDSRLCYEDYPTSKYRPVNQFCEHEEHNREDPILTILTVTRGPNLTSFYETTKFIKSQALKAVRWVILCDHISDTIKYSAIRDVTDSDSRFFAVNNTGVPGVSSTRNSGLHFFKRNPTKYVTFIDDDDQMELNAYEKLVWVLESNRHAAMSISHSVFYGEDAMKMDRGFHDGERNLIGFYLTITVFMRSSAILKTDCMFNEGYNTGMEDWDFFLCIASKGMWGVTVPEYLFWYNRKSADVRKTRWPVLSSEQGAIRRNEIRNRYKFMKDQFPNVLLEETSPDEAFPLYPTFKNLLGKRKGILLIIPGVEMTNINFYLSLVRSFSERGYPVSILITSWKISRDYNPHNVFQRYTHDVFIVPTFLRFADVPRFVRYIIDSRSVTHIILGHSAVGYNLLPIIRTFYKGIIVIDIKLRYKVFTVDEEYLKLSDKYLEYTDGTISNVELDMQHVRKNRTENNVFYVKFNGIFSSIQDSSSQNASLEKVGAKAKDTGIFRFTIIGDGSNIKWLNPIVKTFCATVKLNKNISKEYKTVEITILGSFELSLSQIFIESCSQQVRISIPGITDENAWQDTVGKSAAIMFLAKKNIFDPLLFSMTKGVVPIAVEGSSAERILKNNSISGIFIPEVSGSKKIMLETSRIFQKLFCENCRKKISIQGLIKTKILVKSDLNLDSVVSWAMDINQRSQRSSKSLPSRFKLQDAFKKMIQYREEFEEFPVFYKAFLNERFPVSGE